jgi:sugar/nucleoside kinase (ribokinase family)
MSVVVVGSIAIDSIITEKSRREKSLGGAALYFANAASHFTNVNLVGVVGTDYDLNDISYLKEKGVNLDGLEVVEGKTFRWGGRYHKNMNHRDSLFTELNVFADFQPKIPENYKNAEYVFLANIHPDLQNDVLEQIKKPKCVVMDTMNFWISGERSSLLNLLKKVDILIINDEEAKELTGEDSLYIAQEKIKEMGPSSVVIKKGEHGAILFTKDSIFSSPAYPLAEVVDPTGAGDTFAGGFVGYLAQKDDLSDKTLRKAVVYGSTMASFVCERFSFDRLKEINHDDIEKRTSDFKKITDF